MNLDTILTSDNIALNASLSSKKRALQLLSQLMATTDASLDENVLFEALCERERLGTTGMGHGIAIPHGRIEGLPYAVAAFIQLKKPINFDTPDNQPVDLIFSLVVPDSTEQEYLNLLSHIAQVLIKPENCAALRAAKNTHAVLDILGRFS